MAILPCSLVRLFLQEFALAPYSLQKRLNRRPAFAYLVKGRGFARIRNRSGTGLSRIFILPCTETVVSKQSETLLRKHTRREFRNRMATGELKACIIPIAAIEQHLEHMAMEHDWRSACWIAERVAENLRPHVLVAEGIMCGISEHHMNHPGTLSLRPGTFISVLEDLIDSMARAGFQNILVLNGHGGNVAPCSAVWDQLLRRFQINLQFLPYWDVLSAEIAAGLLDSPAPNFPGHAQEFETSFALAAFPENVRTDMWTDQADPTPALATPAKGGQFIELLVERVRDFLTDMIEGRRSASVPPFHP